MNPIWIVILILVGIFVLSAILRKPIVLEGRAIEKKIAQGDGVDSHVTIETPAKQKIVLKFETHSVAVLVQIGGESFHDRAEELDRAIALNDEIKVETLDTDGVTRDVYKLLSVSSSS